MFQHQDSIINIHNQSTKVEAQLSKLENKIDMVSSRLDNKIITEVANLRAMNEQNLNKTYTAFIGRLLVSHLMIIPRLK